MCHAFNGERFHQRQQRLHVDARRRHDQVGQRFAVELLFQIDFVGADDLAHQRVTVGMRAVRGEADHRIARLDVRTADDAGLLHHAYCEAREVVFSFRIHAGHLGGFAADQRAPGLFASGCDALDDLGGSIHIQFAAGEVIEEEQRFRALHQNIVDAHAD